MLNSYSGRDNVPLMVNIVNNITAYGWENVFILFFPGQGFNSDLWDCMLAFYLLKHPCLLNLEELKNLDVNVYNPNLPLCYQIQYLILVIVLNIYNSR